MMEKSAQAGEGGVGVTAHHLSLYLPSRTKLLLYAPAESLPISTLPLYVLCVPDFSTE